VVRPGLVWGDDPGGVMGNLVKLVRRFPLVPLLVGNPQPHQYLVHQEDLGRCVVSLCKNKATRQRYTAAYPLPLSLKDILSTIAAQEHLRRAYLPLPWRFAHILLAVAEIIGIPLAFRSDSLIGLVFSAPFLQDESPPEGITYRIFK
jgi:NADH dehydrogenase